MKRAKKSPPDPAARAAAMKAKPHRRPPISTEEKDDKLYVTVSFSRPRWQRLLGADEDCQRTFGLDDYGRRVYDSCDGKLTVQGIIKRFSKATQVSQPEAEMAVTKFLKTLLSKGLVVMEMDKRRA